MEVKFISKLKFKKFENCLIRSSLLKNKRKSIQWTVIGQKVKPTGHQGQVITKRLVASHVGWIDI